MEEVTAKKWWPVLCWMALIFVGSSIPARQLPQTWVFSYDKVLHGLEYALLGALACRAAGLRGAAPVVAGVLVASIFGASDEFHQLFVTGRACDIRDWIADTVGGTFGAVAWRLARG